jgi:TolB-like protein/Tfp pilus assembly protein PilF
VSLPLIAELKRRRVFRALVAYGIAAFAVLQIIEPVMHGLHWPETVLSYVVVALAVGFPIVVALAWVFDVREGRLEKTKGAPLSIRRSMLLVGIGLVAAAPGLFWYFGMRPKSDAAASAASIAVLPFVNLSGDAANEFFSDGMTEEIINALANVEGLRVVARTSAFSFKGKNLDVRKIGGELNVATVLEGTVRRQGDRLRVAAQLVAAKDGYHLWSKTWDRELNDVFAVEDDVARSIVEALKPRLVPSTPMVERTTASSDAHDLYLKGRYFWNQRSREGLTKAMAAFERAIAIDPRYALAHSGLADCYSLLGDYGWRKTEDQRAKAKAHALEALELDPDLAEGHVSLAGILNDEYDWQRSDREFRRAIALRPGYATAHHWYGFSLLAQGRLPEAGAEGERARQLDPTSVIINTFLTSVLFHGGDHAAAIEQAQKTLDLNPGFDLARMFLAYSNLLAARPAAALAAVNGAPARSAWLSAARAQVLASSGATAEARGILEDVERRRDTEFVPPGTLALAHLALGEKDAAFSLLEEGIASRDQSVRTLKSNPLWNPIRSDPRYAQLLKRMNLEP